MFGAFNIWKNPLLLNPVLSRAQKEIYKALLRNREQFQNDTIFLRVALTEAGQPPVIHVVDSEDKLYEALTFRQLLDDPDLQKQLDSIPSFIRKKIDFDKIIDKINRAVGKALGSDLYAKVIDVQDRAQINLHRKSDHELVRRDATLKDFLDADQS